MLVCDICKGRYVFNAVLHRKDEGGKKQITNESQLKSSLGHNI